MEDRKIELMHALTQGHLYDFISNNGHRFEKQELIDIIKNLDYTIYSHLGEDKSNKVEKLLIQTLEDAEFWEKKQVVRFNPSNEDVNEILKLRQHSDVFYVLVYDIKTTQYKNEMEFMTFEKANKKFLNTKAGEGERVELMFAPEHTDSLFKDNVVIMSKELGY